jgi:hypothetical protein
MSSPNKKTEYVNLLPKFDTNANAAKIKKNYDRNGRYFYFKQYKNTIFNPRKDKKSIEFTDNDLYHIPTANHKVIPNVIYKFDEKRIVKYKDKIIKRFKINESRNTIEARDKVFLFYNDRGTSESESDGVEVELSKQTPINFTIEPEPKSNGENIKSRSRSKSRSKSKSKSRGGTRKMKKYSARL